MEEDNLLTNLHDNPALRNVDKQLLSLIDTYTRRLRETVQDQNNLIHFLKETIQEMRIQIETLERGY